MCRNLHRARTVPLGSRVRAYLKELKKNLSIILEKEVRETKGTWEKELGRTHIGALKTGRENRES